MLFQKHRNVPGREHLSGGSAAYECLRSKRPIHAKRGAFVHALRVQVGGGAPTPHFCPTFSKVGEMFPSGNAQAALPPGNAAQRQRI